MPNDPKMLHGRADADLSFIGASMEHGQRLMDSEMSAGRTVTGRTVSANFPPFVTLPGNSARPLQRGEPLEVIAARPAGGRSLLVQDIAKLEQQLIAAGVAAGADGAPTYCGVPIIENKFLPPGKVYIIADDTNTASLIAALSDVLPLMGKKP
ncbi:hypothetical protein [Stenotrophomonas phage BUCT603]|nr:hypothetical protein [Stenotrophomonas phage BUCT603]